MTDQSSCDPTEKTLYRELHSDHWGSFEDRMFECGQGPRKLIGIDVGGVVYVLPLKRWHQLAQAVFPITKELI